MGDRRAPRGDRGIAPRAAGAIVALRGERAIVINDVRGIVDMVMLRVAIFLIAGVVLAPLVAHAYARVWPRR